MTSPASADRHAAGTYRSEAEVSAALQALEESRDLLRFQLDGWCAWPLLRFSVSRALQQVPLDHGASAVSKRRLLPVIAADLLRVATARKSPTVVKTYSSAHMEAVGSRRKDVYFDDLLPALGRTFKVEAVNNGRILRRGAQLVPRDTTTYAINILADRLGRGRPPAGVAPLAEALSAEIREGLGLTSFTAPRVAGMLTSFHWGRRVYRSLLARLGAEVLLLADTGDHPVTAAARELGMAVVEFQHGFTHRHFPGNSWSAYARSYKGAMPLPTRIFTYGEHWAAELAVNGFWDEELRAVGSTRIDRHRALPRQKPADECVLVLTAQGTDTAQLAAFLAEFTRLAEGVLPYRLDIKLHPAYHTDDGVYRAAIGDNPRVRIIPGLGEPSTFDLLRGATLHLSIYSTCHYEALALGVPTAILPMTGTENVEHLAAAGHAFAPATPAELLAIAGEWRNLTVLPGVGDRYFASGALDTASRELRALRGRGQ